MPCRRHIVTQMVDRLLDTMIEHARVHTDISGDETLAVVMSLALRVMKGAKATGADPRRMRAGVEVLLMECAEEGKKAN